MQEKEENRDIITVTSTGTGNYQNILKVGPHEIRADEPFELGGDDTGPSPFDLLKMSLGACKSITLSMYARRKQIPLEGISVEVTHRQVDADESAQFAGKTGKINQFHCEIHIKGDDISEDVKARMIQIADKCPVHKALEGEVSIITTQS